MDQIIAPQSDRVHRIQQSEKDKHRKSPRNLKDKQEEERKKKKNQSDEVIIEEQTQMPSDHAYKQNERENARSENEFESDEQNEIKTAEDSEPKRIDLKA